MKFNRSSGILLHPTSLPGPYGIGDLGPAAYRWIDWLAETGCKLWQILPLGPTGYGDSPYQCFSAFAGNPYLISPEILIGDGLLNRDDLSDMPDWNPREVDFGAFYLWKPKLLEKAYENFKRNGSNEVKKAVDAFRLENTFWLEDYALFTAIKEAHGGGAWDGWPEGTAPAKRSSPAKAERHLGRPNPGDNLLSISFLYTVGSCEAPCHTQGITNSRRHTHLRGDGFFRRLVTPGLVLHRYGWKTFCGRGSSAGLFFPHRAIVGQPLVPLGSPQER